MLWEALQHGALLRVAAAKQAGLRTKRRRRPTDSSSRENHGAILGPACPFPR
jgi:hypothetical protein